MITPFRWLEIESWPANTKPEGSVFVRKAALAADWEDAASHFASSDEALNRIWELCKYSIKTTTFAGVYVDDKRAGVLAFIRETS